MLLYLSISEFTPSKITYGRGTMLFLQYEHDILST